MVYAVTVARLVYKITREATVAIAEDYFETETTVPKNEPNAFST